MNNKEIRKYDLMVQIGNQGGALAIKELATIDFNLAVDMWEYKMIKDINAFAGKTFLKFWKMFPKANYARRC